MAGPWLYQHSGWLPHLNIRVLIMVTKVLVDFFEEWDEWCSVTDYYHAMHYVALNCTPPVDPPVSHAPEPIELIPSNSSPIITQLSEDIENQLLQQLTEDGEDELDDSKDVEIGGMDVMDGFGTSLVIDPDGEGSSFWMESEDSSFESPFTLVVDLDIAWTESMIVDDLPSDISMMFPFDLVQLWSQSEFPLNFLDVELTSFKNDNNITKATYHSNAEATAYQEVVAAEDTLADRLCNLLLTSMDPNIHSIIAPHISPRIHWQLPEWTPPTGFLTLPSASSSPISTISTPIESKQPPMDHDKQTWASDMLQGLFPQRKECCKESHGVR